MAYTTLFATNKGRNLDVGISTPVVIPVKCAVFTLHVRNRAAAVRYLKLYDKATNPLATDIPFHTIELAANSSDTIFLNAFMNAGFGMRATQGLADNDNIAPLANEVIVNWIANV